MADPVRIGDVVGRWTVEALLGRGGMGEVHRVRDRDGRVAVLKTLHLHGHNQARERFEREGRIQAALRHPNVVSLLEVVDHGDAQALVLEYVDGGSLEARMAASRLEIAEALRIFAGIVDGLEAVHAAGLVHRDLKPGNVLLTSERPPVPKLADFGLSRDDDLAPLTRTSAALGTPGYMAPEQWRDAHSVDLRADIWSLGVLLYELMVGYTPFAGASPPVVMAQVLSGRYVPLESLVVVPREVAVAVAGCLVVDVSQRIPDCATLRDVLAGRRAWRVGPEPTLSPESAAPRSVTETWVPPDDEPPSPPPPPPRRSVPVPPLRLLAVPVVVAAAALGLGSPVDTLAWPALSRSLAGVIPADDVVVIGIGDSNVRALRTRHPALLHGLAQAGATAVFLDIAMPEPDLADVALAEAIRALPIPVVMPVQVRFDAPVPPGTRALASAVRLGLVDLETDPLLGIVRRAPVIRRFVDGSVVWGAPVELVRAHTRSGEPVLGAELEIGERAVRVDGERVWIAPIGPIPVVPYDQPERFGVVKGKVVLVGAWGGEVDLHRGPDGAAYGVELLAAAVQTILSGRAPMPFGVGNDALLAAALGVVSWVGATWDRRAPYAVGAVAMGICGALLHAWTLPSLLPPVAAVVAGAWAARRSVRWV